MLKSKRLTGKFHFTRWGIVALAVVVALGSIGITYAGMSGKGKVKPAKFADPFSWAVSNDDGTAENYGGFTPIDPGDSPTGLDPSQPQAPGQEESPRYDEDVALTEATLVDPDNITVILTNAYPSYYPTVFYGIKNAGTVPATIESIVVDEDYTGEGDNDPNDIPALTVAVSGISEGKVIAPGEEVIGDLEIHVEMAAEQDHTYHIKVTITTVYEEEKHGTAYAYYSNKNECFLVMDEINTNRWGWTNGPLGPGNYTFDIYAGAGGCYISTETPVGTVTIGYDGSIANVTYDMFDGYTMESTHLYVGNDPLPKDKKGNYTVAPGQYGNTHDLNNATIDKYTIPGLSGDIHVVAHAVVYGLE